MDAVLLEVLVPFWESIQKFGKRYGCHLCW